MLFEQWQAVDRFLLCCPDGVATLKPALQWLSDSLPEIQITILFPACSDPPVLQLPGVQTTPVQEWVDRNLIEWLRQQSFDAVIIFTEPLRSPYAVAYLCYLAGIPIRVGQSQEFGGSVLSTCVTPPLEQVSPEIYHLHLLQSAGFHVDVESYKREVAELKASA